MMLGKIAAGKVLPLKSAMIELLTLKEEKE